MPRCHILVQRIYRFRPRHLPVFLVHIVCAGTRVVADPYAKILDLGWATFVNLARSVVSL